MQLIDALTPRDKETIKHYIQLYADVAEPAPLSHLLRVWNKQKRTLYKALGNNLRVSIPVEIPRNETYFHRALKDIYEVYPVWDRLDAFYVRENLNLVEHKIHNDFVFEYIKFIANQNWDNEDYFNASRLIMHDNIKNGYIRTVSGDTGYKFHNFNATIKNNMRTVRTIQKVLKGMNFPKMDLFEKWRNKISDLNINRNIKTNLVLSIHPIDFMTMSHNNCDWSSCMNWDGGSYSTGTIEMLNSNMTILAYLESDSPFFITFDEEKFFIPNKSWRSLFYINKHIIVGGRAYPYANDNLTKKCLEELMTLLNKNLKWDYQYKYQRYADVQNIHNNFFLKQESLSQFNRPKNRNKQKHAIYLYTNSMYNDLIEYNDDYYCCRNWVPKTMRFCVSGPATCMCCGDYLENPRDIVAYDDLGSKKICWKCEQNRCDICGNIYFNDHKFILKNSHKKDFYVCSDECLSNVIYFPKFNVFQSKDVLKNDIQGIVISSDDKLFSKDKHTIQEKKFAMAYFLPYEEQKYNLMNRYNVKKIIDLPYFLFSHLYHTIIQVKVQKDDFCFDSGYNFLFVKPDSKIEGETIENKIIKYIKENFVWVPAKEVINEGCSTFSDK